MDYKIHLKYIVSLLILLLSFPALSLTGDAIIKMVDKHEDGYIDLSADIEMILLNQNGNKKNRYLSITSIEKIPLGDKRMYAFKSPSDVKGTTVLIHSNVTVDDSQWIYLPAFKRVKRVSTSNKKTPFVGSQFTYEDLSSQEKEKYVNEYIGEIKCGHKKCFKVKRTPKYNHSGYSHLISYIDKNSYRYVKIDYMSKDNRLIKTQIFLDYKLYNNRFLIANKLKMTNHLSKKITIMKWTNVKLNNHFMESGFSRNALRRMR